MFSRLYFLLIHYDGKNYHDMIHMLDELTLLVYNRVGIVKFESKLNAEFLSLEYILVV